MNRVQGAVEPRNAAGYRGRHVSVAPDTKIGAVSLTVSSLERQIPFYEKVLGFTVAWRKGLEAGLGAGGRDLLRLVEVPGARRAPRTTGLYHFAVLFPDRRELARAVARLIDFGYPNHPTDHIMTKTTYLTDPEGQEIELYTESPEDGTWEMNANGYFAHRADGSLSDGREPLDVEALLGNLLPGDALDQPLPPQTRIGHVHLYVRDVPEAMRFYTDVIGFDDMGYTTAFMMGMVSAGGYHHHVGLNSWMGNGAPPAPPQSLGMRHFEVVLPTEEELARVVQRVKEAGVPREETGAGPLVRDPSQNALILTTRRSA